MLINDDFQKIIGKYKNKQSAVIKKLLFKNNIKPKKCEKCSVGEYHNNLPLVLQLHHIDGDSSNNMLNNLQILCPNCHSQTDTFRSKKILSDREIISACADSKSINEVIIKLQRHPSGGLYKRIENVIINYSIPIEKYNYNKPRRSKSSTEKTCELCGSSFLTLHEGKRFCSKECVNKNKSSTQTKWKVTDLNYTLNLVKQHGWQKAATILKVADFSSTPGCILRLAVKREIKQNNLNIDISNISKFKNRSRKW